MQKGSGGTNWSGGFWRRWSGIALCVLAASTLTSCATRSTTVSPRLPVSVAPSIGDAQARGMGFNAWLEALVNAYRDNCVTLQTIIGGETWRCDPLRGPESKT